VILTPASRAGLIPPVFPRLAPWAMIWRTLRALFMSFVALSSCTLACTTVSKALARPYGSS